MCANVMKAESNVKSNLFELALPRRILRSTNVRSRFEIIKSIISKQLQNYLKVMRVLFVAQGFHRVLRGGAVAAQGHHAECDGEYGEHGQQEHPGIERHAVGEAI